MSQVEPILDIKNATISLHFFNCFFQELISVITNLKPKKPNSSHFASISVYSRNVYEYSSMSDAIKEFFSIIRSNLAKSSSQVETILDIENAIKSLHFFNCFFEAVSSVITNLKPKKNTIRLVLHLYMFKVKIYTNTSQCMTLSMNFFLQLYLIQLNP